MIEVFSFRDQLFKAWLRPNPGLKFDLVFWFLIFYASVYFETLKIIILFERDKMPEGIFLNSQAIKLFEKIASKFKLTRG